MIYGVGSEKVMTQNGQIARRRNSIFHKICKQICGDLLCLIDITIILST